MNKLVIGFGDKTKYFSNAPRTFLLIDDDDHFLSLFPRATVYDPREHSFDPLKGMDHRIARDFAETVYSDKDLMTYEDGKSALTHILLETKRLDRLPHINHKGNEHAHQKMGDLLLSPVLKHALCRTPNFVFRNQVIAQLNRAEIGDADAFLLASLLIRQFRQQIIIPDFGFYARPFHVSLIRQGRLMAGVNTLDELDHKIRQMCLLMEKEGHHCTFEDAEVLARYARLVPHQNNYNEEIDRLMA